MEPDRSRTSPVVDRAFSLGEEVNPTTSEWYDVVRLSEAIAMHETGMGTVAHSTGAPPSHNVCGLYNSTAGQFYAYDSIEEGLAACQGVLTRVYYGKSIEQIAQRWTTTQRSEWINNVTHFYYGD